MYKYGIELKWKEEKWVDYYYITENIIDAAVLWKKDSYISGTFMCISFHNYCFPILCTILVRSVF